MATTLDSIDRRLGDLFRREISPHLAGLEAERQRRRFTMLATLGGIAIGVPSVAWVSWSIGPPLAMVAATGLGVLGVVLAQHQQRAFRHQLRKLVMPAICNAIGDIEHTSGDDHAMGLAEPEALGLLPRHDRRRIDDVFRGRHRDTSFVMAETHLLRRGTKNRTRTVFRGLILRIDVPRRVEAQILIGRDAGGIGNRLAGWWRGFSGLERVQLPHPAFEDRFELYSDRPATARETVGPVICDALVAIADAHDGRPIAGAFTGDSFYLAMPKRGDQFALGSLLRPLDTLEAEAHRVLGDVRLIHRVIDALHGDVSAIAAARPSPAPARPSPAEAVTRTPSVVR